MGRTDTRGPYLFVRVEKVLSEEQDIAQLVQRRNKDKNETQALHGKTRDILADRAGVSSETVRQVKKVLEVIKDENVLNMCRSGRIKVSQAYRLTKLSENHREEAVWKLREGVNIKAVLQTIEYDDRNHDIVIQEYMESAQKVMESIGTVWKTGEEVSITGNLFADLSREHRELEQKLKKAGVTGKTDLTQWIVIVPAMTETGWFQKLCQSSDGLCLASKRKIAIFYHGTHSAAFTAEFQRYGFCV